jgi:hypothetical protein
MFAVALHVFKAADVWKCRQSIHGEDKYPATYLQGLGARYVTEFEAY